MSSTFCSVHIPEPSNTIRLPWSYGSRVPTLIWIRVGSRIFREDAGAFDLDREKGLLVFKAFRIDPRDDVLVGATLVNVLQALAEAAQD